MFCRSFFVILSFFFLAIVLSVLRFEDSDYSFDIFKLFDHFTSYVSLPESGPARNKNQKTFFNFSLTLPIVIVENSRMRLYIFAYLSYHDIYFLKYWRQLLCSIKLLSLMCFAQNGHLISSNLRLRLRCDIAIRNPFSKKTNQCLYISIYVCNVW